MINYTHSAVLIGVIAITTIIIRSLPFLVFRGKELPSYIVFLGETLPKAIIAMLVVYCLKGISFADYHNYLPYLVSVLAVIVIQATTRKSLLSIGIGTAIYIILVNFVL